MVSRLGYLHSRSVARSAWLPGIRTSCGPTNISWDNLGISASSSNFHPYWAAT